MIKIQEHIRKHGLDKTISKFRLNLKDLGHKVMIKYSQLDSPKQYKEVHEARGIIFDTDKWNIMSYPFNRFFDHNDFYSPKLNWKEAVVMEKRDGSLIQVYYDYVKEEFVCNTMFSECEELLYVKGERSDLSLKTIFHDLLKEYGSSYDLFIKGNTYIFELTSQFNKVLVKYGKPELRLLSVRNLKSLQEYNWSVLNDISKGIKIPIVETYKFSSLKEALDSFKGLSFNFEGYVAWDGINRIKIKNPAYVAVYLTKSTEEEVLDLSKPYVFLDVVKQNEIDEFVSSFPHAAGIIQNLNKNYYSLIEKLNNAARIIEGPKNITKEEQKKFATSIFNAVEANGVDKSLGNVFFLIANGRVESIEDYLYQFDNKKLYKLLK